MFNAESLKQALAHARDHGVEIGLGTELAGEFDQGAAVVVAVTVEVFVEALLDPVADGVEQEGGGQHDGHGDHVAHVLEVLFDQAAEGEDEGVESGHNAKGGERIRVAPAEDDIDVHQAVAHDGVGQGERNQHDAEHAHLHIGIGHRAHHVRQNIEEGEGQDAIEGAVA